MTASVDGTDRVDWLAVEIVCTGTRMRLAGDPATLAAAIRAIGHDLTMEQIAERLGTTTRQVQRVLEESGAIHCPSCRRSVLLQDEIVPRHVNANGFRCRMSGYPVTDSERVRQIRADRRQIWSVQ